MAKKKKTTLKKSVQKLGPLSDIAKQAAGQITKRRNPLAYQGRIPSGSFPAPESSLKEFSPIPNPQNFDFSKGKYISSGNPYFSVNVDANQRLFQSIRQRRYYLKQLLEARYVNPSPARWKEIEDQINLRNRRALNSWWTYVPGPPNRGPAFLGDVVNINDPDPIGDDPNDDPLIPRIPPDIPDDLIPDEPYNEGDPPPSWEKPPKPKCDYRLLGYKFMGDCGGSKFETSIYASETSNVKRKAERGAFYKKRRARHASKNRQSNTWVTNFLNGKY